MRVLRCGRILNMLSSYPELFIAFDYGYTAPNGFNLIPQLKDRFSRVIYYTYYICRVKNCFDTRRKIVRKISIKYTYIYIYVYFIIHFVLSYLAFILNWKMFARIKRYLLRLHFSLVSLPFNWKIRKGHKRKRVYSRHAVYHTYLFIREIISLSEITRNYLIPKSQMSHRLCLFRGIIHSYSDCIVTQYN